MSLRLRRTLLASAISSLACGAVAAQETPQLNDIVVTASGFEQQISSAPASISVISREELERGHYQNVTDALRDVPGVVVTGGGAGDNGNDISIRGMPSQYTLILVDGRPQNSRESRPNGSAGFEQDWLPPPAKWRIAGTATSSSIPCCRKTAPPATAAKPTST